MAIIYNPPEGETHVTLADGTIYFPNTRRQWVYHPANKEGWYYVPEMREQGYELLAGPCGLCGHLREQNESIRGPAGQLICHSCALKVANALSQELLGRGLLEEPRKKSSRTPVGAVLRNTVLARDGYTCRYCGATDDLTMDHILPVVRGGKNTLENLVTCCGSCNSRKCARTLEEAGMTLRPLAGDQA